MGQESVREDFLAGRNGAVQLGEEDLKHLDDLYIEVLPKHERENGALPFQVCGSSLYAYFFQHELY
jgi:caprin-1